MIQIAVIDDEKIMLEKIQCCIEREKYNEIEILCFVNAESFLKYLKRGINVNIVFCDIELPAMSGIELGKIIRKEYPATYLIYLTSHAEFAVESYMIEAYQYIMKECMEIRIQEVLTPLLDKLKAEIRRFKILQMGMCTEKVYYKDIVSIYKEKGSKYIRYVTVNGEFRERKTLEAVIRELQSKEFIIVERGVIVNIKHVVKLKGTLLFLDNGDTVTISKLKLRAVKEKITLNWGDF